MGGRCLVDAGAVGAGTARRCSLLVTSSVLRVREGSILLGWGVSGKVFLLSLSLSYLLLVITGCWRYSGIWGVCVVCQKHVV